MAQSIDEQELMEEQQRLRDEVQRLRDEQQRLRDEQEKLRQPGGAQANPAESKPAESKPAPDANKAADNNGEPKNDAKKKKRFRPVTLLIIGLVIAALAIGGFFLWGYLSSYESTDDAQVDGNIDPVSSRINGTAVAVHFEDNQHLEAGQLLVELDPRDYLVAVESAKAELAGAEREVSAQNPNVPITTQSNETTIQTSGLDVAAAQASVASAEANVASAEQEYQSALAQVRLAQANHNNDEAEVVRYKSLVDKDEVSREQYDTKVTTAKASQATVEANQAVADSRRKQVDQARAQVNTAVAQLNTAKARERLAQQNAPRNLAIQQANVQSRQADVDKDRAALDQAKLNLEYCRIYSPVTGVATKKSAQIGTRVSPGQELLSVVPLDDLWITANFKETQLKQMRPGQRVTIKVDAFHREYEGKVESVAGTSGAKTSLLPPENATGNYVKVVQRIPVRIRLNHGEDSDHSLRPGMSVEPKVWLQ
jgi:membrane fusion protein, multidrug efflux system